MREGKFEIGGSGEEIDGNWAYLAVEMARSWDGEADNRVGFRYAWW